MDLLISPTHFLGILAEYDFNLVNDTAIFTLTPNFEGGLHMGVSVPSKPYSILTLQIREKKIIYNKILEWKLAMHYKVPDKVLKIIRERCVVVKN